MLFPSDNSLPAFVLHQLNLFLPLLQFVPEELSVLSKIFLLAVVKHVVPVDLADDALAPLRVHLHDAGPQTLVDLLRRELVHLVPGLPRAYQRLLWVLETYRPLQSHLRAQVRILCHHSRQVLLICSKHALLRLVLQLYCYQTMLLFLFRLSGWPVFPDSTEYCFRSIPFWLRTTPYLAV